MINCGSHSHFQFLIVLTHKTKEHSNKMRTTPLLNPGATMMDEPRPLLDCYNNIVYYIGLLLWTIGYIWIGLWCFDTGGDIGVAVFNFIVAVGILLLINVLLLLIRPLVNLFTTNRFDKAYHDDNLAQTLSGHVVRSVWERNCFHTATIEYTVLLQTMEIIVRGQEEMDSGSSIDLRVLRWHPRSGIYLDEWNRDLRRQKWVSCFWLLLGTPFMVYYVLILYNFTDLGGFPWGMLVWHLFYVVPPVIIYGRHRSRHVAISVVNRARQAATLDAGMV